MFFFFFTEPYTVRFVSYFLTGNSLIRYHLASARYACDMWWYVDITGVSHVKKKMSSSN